MKRPEPGRSKPRTVLHVIDALNYGGAQKLIVLLAQWTPANAYKTIVCALQPNWDVEAALTACGAKVICLARRRPSILSPHRLAAYIYHNLKDIRRICKTHDVDVVQCHLSDAEFLGISAGRLAGVRRVVTTVHYPDLLPQRKGNDPRNYLRRLTTRLLYRMVDYVIAVSDDVADQLNDLWRLSGSKLRIMTNRIDVQAQKDAAVADGLKKDIGLGERDRMLLSVGRLMPPKGQSHLIGAMAEIAKRFDDVKLALAGDGDLRDRLKKRAADLGLEKRIIFLGSRDDIAQLLKLSDIFVLPSLWEGTSLALLEAMAAAKPIVATDIPGNRAVLKDGVNGLLVPSGDAFALARAIGQLLADPKKAAALGRKAQKEAVDHYDIRTSVAELMALWQ